MYNVMNRGRRGEKIFSTKKDYQSFIDLLEELNDVSKCDDGRWQTRNELSMSLCPGLSGEYRSYMGAPF